MFKVWKVSAFLTLTVFLTMPLNVWAQKYTVKPVTNGATISGSVFFEGALPKPRVITVTKDKEIAKDTKRMVDVVSVDDGKLADAVVYLKKVAAGKDWPKLPDDGLIDQKGARFILHSKVVYKDVPVPIKNSDPVMHNIHAYELIGRGRRTIFNRGQIKGKTFHMKFDTRRTPYVKLECDAHNFMHDYLFVASNPYFSVTGKDGAFNITDVPAGTYTLIVWHPDSGTQETKITVDAGQKTTHDFTFKGDGGSK